jgi:hypothetical protein
MKNIINTGKLKMIYYLKVQFTKNNKHKSLCHHEPILVQSFQLSFQHFVGGMHGEVGIRN